MTDATHTPTRRPATARRHLLHTAVRTGLTLALGSTALLPAAQAQATRFPDKPITFVVPFAAASATDQLARALGQAVSEATKQPVVIDNKAGASGMLATQAVARAPADGHTVLIATNTTHAANEHLFRKIGYDPVKDFAPITTLARGGQVLVVRTDAPWRSVAELVAAARKTPGKLSFASGSASSRVAGEQFKDLSATDILHVPYKSNPQALTDLIGGQVDLMITDTATGVPHIKAGKLRALGYSTHKRSPLLPDVPTIEEAGVKGYEMSYWFAAYAPAGTPQPVVARLNELLQAAVKSASAKAFFESGGAEAWAGGPAELAKFQAAETQRWGRMIKAAGIEPE
ncbi:MAG: hypothetical protein RLY78_2208 [Pseudomonadota bacterium]|jgi:tripartite-type tricarboxylate transporter receptor subunit TctC